MKQIRSTITTAFIICMVAAALVVPVLAAGSSSSHSIQDSEESEGTHTPRPTATPTPAPTTHPTTAPPPVTIPVPTTVPTAVPTPAPTTPVPTVAPVPVGSISLNGAQSSTVTSSRLAMGAMIHHGDFVDSQGNTWGGIPLWYLVGFIDDTVGNPTGSHGSSTFNDALAAAGYTVMITGKSGSTATFPSRMVVRNSSYIIATTLNGVSIPASDPSGPYKLVGAGVAPAQNVGGVNTISINFGSTPTPQPTPTTAPTPSPSPTTNGTVPTPTQVPTIVPTLTPLPPVNSTTTLSLTGAVSRSITQSYMATGVGIGHHGTYTDSQGNVWDGMPLWYFAGMIDDNVQHGPGAFNDALATAGYTITVTGRDGKVVNLDSKNVARSNAYLIANKKNGVPIPFSDPSAPFVLVGSGAGIGSGIAGVAGISVTSTPGSPVTIAPTPTQPVTPVPTTTTVPSSTSIQLTGAQSVTVSPEYFTRGASVHPGTYTDSQGITWTGIPLWYLVGFADDATGSTSGHGSTAFNDVLADAGYTITVSGSSGAVTLDSKSVKRSSAYIIANAKGGSATEYTLIGNGAGIGSGVQGVSSISLSLGAATPTPTPTVSPTVTPNQTDSTAWNISVEGKMNKIVTRSWFEGGVAAGHAGTYKDPEGKTWQGIPLWYFAGLADDTLQHGPGAFSDAAAREGYTITVFGKDGKTVILDSKSVARSNNYLIANWLNQAVIPASDANAPAALVGEGINSSQVISGVDRIVLTFPGGAGADSLTTGDRTKSGDVTANTGENPGSGRLTGPNGTSPGTIAITPVPTFTIKISFTPLPEIVIQYGQPGLNTAAGTAATPAESSTNKSMGTSPATADKLTLTGAIDDTVTIQKVVDGVAYGHEGEFTDAEGNTYKGMPLWFFAGWVDDENSHSAGAFNDDLARKGYNITVSGSNGETVISGTDAMRSDGYLIATTKNGERMTAETGGPLMLVGNSVPSDYTVKGVSAIALDLASSA